MSLDGKLVPAGIVLKALPLVLVAVLYGFLLSIAHVTAQALLAPVLRKALAEVKLPLAVWAAFVALEDLPALSLVPDELVVAPALSFALVAREFGLGVVIGGIMVSFVDATEEVPLAYVTKLGVVAGTLGHVLNDESLGYKMAAVGALFFLSFAR